MSNVTYMPTLPLEPLLISVLFAAAAVAFIGVLNARGTWRTKVASLLALLCLATAVFHTARYRAYKQAVQEGPAPAALPVPAPIDDYEGPDGSGDTKLSGLMASARALRDSIAVEDPTRARALSDSAYQAFENRTDAYLTQARKLREDAANIAAAPPAGLEEAAEYLNLSLAPLVTAARDLNAFFHAENKDEERKLLESFHQSVQAADTPLRQAESRLGAPSPDSAP